MRATPCLLPWLLCTLIALMARVDACCAQEPLSAIQGVKAGVDLSDVRLELANDPALRWSLYRDSSRELIGSTLLEPDGTGESFTDAGAVSLAAGSPLY